MEIPEESYELYYQYGKGKLSRSKFISRMGAIGATALTIDAFLKVFRPGMVEAAERAGEARAASADGTLSITVYDWILQLYPGLYNIAKAYNAQFKDRLPVKFDVASSSSFSITQFLLEARKKKSTWDVYFGTTPFVEMTQLLATGASEPWDPYVSKSFVADLIPSIRTESSVNGKLIDLPVLVDVIGYGYRKDYFQAAGITKVPATWEDFIATATTISTKLKSHSPRVYGSTIDPHPWRSFIPICHSIDKNIYTTDGYLDWNNKKAVFKQALLYLKQIIANAPPDVFNPGVLESGTFDETEFKSGTAAMLVKYYNVTVRDGHIFGDAKLGLAPLPKPASGGAGASVFWNTGCALLKYGQHKQEAAQFLEWLNHNADLWKAAFVIGQLPPTKSEFTAIKSSAPGWVPPVLSQLSSARAIPNDLYNFPQFTALENAYVPFLRGQGTVDDCLAKAEAACLKAIKTGSAG